MSLLHGSRNLVYVRNVALLVVVIRHNVFEFWTVVLRLHTTQTIIFNRWLLGTLATRLGKSLAINEDICGMRVPIHLQARVEPVGLRIHLSHYVFYLALELDYLWGFGLLLSR